MMKQQTWIENLRRSEVSIMSNTAKNNTICQQKKLSILGKTFAELAHQIRTPLATAMIYASQLENDSNLDVNKRNLFIKKLVNRLKFIEQLIKNLLQFVRGDIGPLQKIDLKSFIDLLCENIETEVTEYHANFELRNLVKNNLEIQVQPESLIAAMQNVIMNSLESSTQSIPIIKCLIKMGKNKNLEFVIEDNGPGISEENLKLVTQSFFTTKAEGTGLGLAIAEAIAKAHGGQLEIISKKGKGTQVSFKLPLNAKE